MSGVVSTILSLVGIFGLGTFSVIAGDLGWFFVQSPLAMAGLCLASAALGYWVHALVRLFLNSRANEDKAFVKRLHTALKEKGCAEYYDIYCKETLDALAERMAERAREALEPRGEVSAEESNTELDAKSATEIVRGMTRDQRSILLRARELGSYVIANDWLHIIDYDGALGRIATFNKVDNNRTSVTVDNQTVANCIDGNPALFEESRKRMDDGELL